MPPTTILATLSALAAAIGLWYWFEGRWDRRLFRSGPGGVCANLRARQAEAWLRDHPETQVLDVRSPGEFARGALPAAVNIPIGDDAFEAKASRLDREKPLLVYCAGGYRSRIAVDRLKQLGFRSIQHLHRGYLSWKPLPPSTHKPE
jgi:rhodanese-related sulfurtransferase